MTDINDNAPMFESNKNDFMVTEGASGGTIVGVVRATDEDEGVNAYIEYRFTNLITDGTYIIMYTWLMGGGGASYEILLAV